jgi:hypothetical protein
LEKPRNGIALMLLNNGFYAFNYRAAVLAANHWYSKHGPIANYFAVVWTAGPFFRQMEAERKDDRPSAPAPQGRHHMDQWCHDTGRPSAPFSLDQSPHQNG